MGTGALDGTVWLTQDEIAELFDKSRSTIAEHIANIYSDGELNEDSTRRDFRRVATDGKAYNFGYYNLEVILAVGFRIRSPRGVHFRRWANTTLREYLIKGFAMDDDRLKQADKSDYFDERLERIRDIRASEKRFYQKTRDLFATAIDYESSSEQAKLFSRKSKIKCCGQLPAKPLPSLSLTGVIPTKPIWV